jgi:hypothetical protein
MFRVRFAFRCTTNPEQQNPAKSLNLTLLFWLQAGFEPTTLGYEASPGEMR